MSCGTRRVRPRKKLTPIENFVGLQCRLSDFFGKTGHRYAVVKRKNGDSDTIDLADTPSLYADIALRYAGETTRIQIDRQQKEAGDENVNLSILYGFCDNLSYYPIAVFHGELRCEETDSESIAVYVPCYWE